MARADFFLSLRVIFFLVFLHQETQACEEFENLRSNSTGDLSEMLLQIKNAQPPEINVLLSKLEKRIEHVIRKTIKRLVPHSDQEEIVQSVLLHIWKKRSLFNFIDHPSSESWVKKVARNYAVDFIRKNKTQRRKFLIPLDAAALASNEKPISEGIVQAEALHEALSAWDTVRPSLSEDHQKIFTLHMEGASSKQIARTTGKPLGTVKSTIRNTRKKIKDIWETQKRPPAKEEAPLKNADEPRSIIKISSAFPLRPSLYSQSQFSSVLDSYSSDQRDALVDFFILGRSEGAIKKQRGKQVSLRALLEDFRKKMKESFGRDQLGRTGKVRIISDSEYVTHFNREPKIPNKPAPRGNYALRPFLSISEEVFKEKLLEIPDEQFRSILNLRYLQDLPPVEIAHELKLPSSKFDKEFRHAFQELMKKLNRRDLTAQDFALMGH